MRPAEAVEERGWETVGIDTVHRARDAAAENNAGLGNATFAEVDVTRLQNAGLGTFDFSLDIGCFHGLSPKPLRRAAPMFYRFSLN